MKASQASLTAQLGELLQTRSLSCDELGLLYCYKHGVSINQALQTVDYDGKFADFMLQEKKFVIENGRATLACDHAQATPDTIPAEVQQPPSCKRNAGPPAAPAPPQAQVDVQQVVQPETDAQSYVDLHNKISSRSFNSKVAQALNSVVEIVLSAVFLNIDHVVKGGSVGKGTAIVGVDDAEVVFFMSVPKEALVKLLPALLKAVAAVLSENCHVMESIESVRVLDGHVNLRLKDSLVVNLRFTGVFDTPSEAIQALGKQTPEARRSCESSLAKEKVQFIAKQPGQIKMTMRLLKWWREQQEWSCPLYRPSDEILELMAVYSGVQTRPADQREAVANVMSLLARFDEVRIVWSNYYGKEDVWAPLLNQRPLLMDPVNPYVNVADPQTFDARELMSLAASTHFFW